MFSSPTKELWLCFIADYMSVLCISICFWLFWYKFWLCFCVFTCLFVFFFSCFQLLRSYGQLVLFFRYCQLQLSPLKFFHWSGLRNMILTTLGSDRGLTKENSSSQESKSPDFSISSSVETEDSLDDIRETTPYLSALIDKGSSQQPRNSGHQNQVSLS